MIKNICLTCGSPKLKRFLKMYSPLLNRPYPIAICKHCGHVQMYPLPSSSFVTRINDSFFGNLYTPKTGFNIGTQKKMKLLDNHLSNYIKPGDSVLEIGPGEGWALEYFKKKDCKYNAIEAVKELQYSIIQRGGTIVGSSVADIVKLKARFDIIIFRMVIEHLTNPEIALKYIRNSLTENGILYCVCPDAMNVNPKGGFTTDYLRPVHISYFNIINVKRLFYNAGLEMFKLIESNNITVIGKKADKLDDMNYENMYDHQKKYFLELHRKYFLTDMKRRLKLQLKRSLKAIKIIK